MKLRGGFSVSTRRRKLSNAGSAPSTSTKTPCEELLTQPARPSSVARRKTNGRKPTTCTAPRTHALSRVRSGTADFISLLDLVALEDHVGRFHGLEVQRIALGADVRQVVCLELMAAFRATHERRDLGQSKRRVFEQAAVFLHQVETELHVIAAVAGERVETDLDELDAPGVLRGGLFLNGVNDGADEMDFVHRIWTKVARPANICQSASRTCSLPARPWGAIPPAAPSRAVTTF